MFTRLGAAALSAVALITFSACSGEPETPAESAPATGGAEPTGQTFDGEVATDTVKVGPQDVLVPKGIKLPEDSVVSQGTETTVMLIDEDPQAVIDAVTSSAAEAGYEVYAQVDEATTVWVGNGNAVSLFAVPQAQMLTWGPESMKDVLTQSPG